jgi:hypothetical protein
MANEHPEGPKGGPEHDETEGPSKPFIEESRRRSYELRRAILDYGMGIVIFCFGIFFLVAPKLGVTLTIEDTFRYIFSGLCLLYGAFRIYRGRQKNYFR